MADNQKPGIIRWARATMRGLTRWSQRCKHAAWDWWNWRTVHATSVDVAYESDGAEIIFTVGAGFKNGLYVYLPADISVPFAWELATRIDAHQKMQARRAGRVS